ncbi:MAG: M48 family metalloprotease [Fimbriimonadaceae bacterium]|nr:M48 family metalloprotease [Fimbriimonadaceae bacterium]
MTTALALSLAIATTPPAHHEVPVADWAWRDAEYRGLPTRDDPKPATPPEEPLYISPARQKDLDSDRELGSKYSAETERQYKISGDVDLSKRLERISKELVPIANRTPVKVSWGDPLPARFEYQIKLIEGDDVNAFSIPGGFIYVFEGLMKTAESDDEIAGVLAHEIAHAAQRHVIVLQRRASKFNVLTLPLIILGILTANPAPFIIGQGVGTALTNGWSVEAEQSADYAAMQYMLRSKYDVTGLLTFMERLAAMERMMPEDLGIYRTHPPGRQRADAITTYMAERGVPVRRSRVSISLRVVIEPGEKDTVLLKMGKRKLFNLAGNEALSRGDAAAQALNEFFDSSPQAFELVMTADGTLTGRRRPLVTLTEEDAAHLGIGVQEFRQNALKQVRNAMLATSFRMWER